MRGINGAEFIANNLRSLIIKYVKIEYLIYTALITVIAVGWLNNNLPTGLDTLGGFQLFDYVRNTFLTQGFLPSWSPSWYMGHPIWYTLSFFIFVPISGSILLYKLVWLLIFILSGIFLYELAYKFTKHRLASFIAGLVYLFIPYHVLSVAQAGAGILNLLFALLPLTFLLIERTFTKPNLTNTIFTAFAVAATVLAYPQAIFLIAPFLMVYVLVRLVWMKLKGQKAIRRIFLAFLVSVILGLLLTMYWWLPFYSDRAYMTSQTFVLSDIESLTLSSAETLLLRPLPNNIPSFNLLGISSYTMIIGAIIPFLAVLGGILSRTKRSLFFLASGATALILAMGPNAPIPLFSYAFKYIPLFNGIRTSGRFLIYAGFCLAILAAFGLRKIFLNVKFKPSKLRAIIAVSLCAVIILTSGIEMQRGFATFTLNSDQQNAINWLNQNASDSLVVPFPRGGWIQIDEAQNRIVNPWYYSSMLNTRFITGGSTMHSTRELLGINYTIGITGDRYGINYMLFDFNYLKYTDTDSQLSVNETFNEVSSSQTFTKVWSEGNVVIFNNTNALPRVYLNYTDAMGEKQFIIDPLNVSYQVINPQTFMVNASFDRPTDLVLTQSYFPNWVAKDLTTGQIIHAKVWTWNFCAFPINAGQHEFCVYYQTSHSQTISLAVSVAVFLICLCLIIVCALKKRRLGVATVKRNLAT